MCTGIFYRGIHPYFGRNLDYEFSYGESVVLLPRNHPISFRHVQGLKRHYAILGMAHLAGDTPLYYDAMNEAGLAIAGLNFVGNARYYPLQQGRENVASFELIPYLLGQARTVDDVLRLLAVMNVTDDRFSEELPASELHWIVADKTRCIVIETLETGMRVHENMACVLTNNPPFEHQMLRLSDFAALSPKNPSLGFGTNIPFQSYSRGMGAIGLPGDLSSSSRFVRAAWVNANAPKDGGLTEFFHLLTAVEQQKGCCEVAPGKYEYTIYSSCCDLEEKSYSYVTYGNRQITKVKMDDPSLEQSHLLVYPLVEGEHILEAKP